MGEHYLAQHYLKGFAQDGGKRIWVYDAQDGRKFATQVKSVANETGFYSQETERYLANEIEGPANPVLDKIRAGGLLTAREKATFAAYLTVMIKRVPQNKRYFREHAPYVAQSLKKELCLALKDAASRNPEKADLCTRREQKILGILDKISEDPPKEVWQRGIPPEMTPGVLEAIKSMTWTFLTFEDRPAFLTCDNPVFWFGGIGIGGRPESEISFPISSHMILWLSWKKDVSEGYYQATEAIVKEMNRRTALNATRYLYHALDEAWILPFVLKGKWQVHLLS